MKKHQAKIAFYAAIVITAAIVWMVTHLPAEVTCDGKPVGTIITTTKATWICVDPHEIYTWTVME